MRVHLVALLLLGAAVAYAQTYPPPSHQDEVKSYNARLNKARVEKTLRYLASDTQRDWTHRKYDTQAGRDSQLWLLGQIQAVAAQYHDQSKISVREFTHPRWPQRSIIARIEGSSSTSSISIVGSHLDSTPNSSPGADDDGSGSVSVLELLNVLVEGKFEPERPVEFHWYAAEEAGLLGAREVAGAYRQEGKEVYGMLQVDMDAYKDATKIRLGQQTSNANLRTFMGQCISEYTSLESFVGFIPGSSDHAAWHAQGYPACFGFEDPMSRFIHSARDTVDTISFDFMVHYLHAVVGFAVETSHLDRSIRPEPKDPFMWRTIGWNMTFDDVTIQKDRA